MRTLPAGGATLRIRTANQGGPTVAPTAEKDVTPMRILVADKLADEGLDFLKQQGSAFDVKVGLKEDELGGEVASGNYDALIVRSGAKVTAKVLDRPGN